jgi:hypothetical protein
MCVSTRYTPLHATRYPAPEETYFYMMNSFLYSRMAAGFPSNDEFFDEDVNVYVAGILTSIVYRERRNVIGVESNAASGGRSAADKLPAAHPGRIAASDASLFEAVAAAGSIREKYELYRTNADHLLVSMGIFNNARGRRPDSATCFSLPRAAYLDRGRMYYSIAQSYAAQLHRRNTAIGEVLGKLSRGFERYVKVLSFMGAEYLNIFKRLSPGELYHLERSAFAIEQRKDLHIHYDRFLDLYSVYLRKKSPRAKKALITAVRDIRLLDPSFTFDLEKRQPVNSP